MNLKEAYATLEIPEGTSPDEAKKKYRALSKKWHPDINKEPEAEAKFKKINEAYQCVQNGKGNEPVTMPQQRGAWPGGFTRQQVIQLENVEVTITIDFKESVLGCKKEVKYTRTAKCPTCDGAGEVRLDNGCTECHGKGQVSVIQRGMVMRSTCTKCQGKSSIADCRTCKGEGIIHTDASVNVSVPAGVINGNILRLQHMGNYAGSVMGIMDQYTDAFCHIKVRPLEGLSIEGRSVVTTIEIPLLNALQGCSRTVKTIFGEKEILIPALSRNRDEVIIPHLGVGGNGDQRVILDVQYPDDTTKLIGALNVEVI